MLAAVFINLANQPRYIGLRSGRRQAGAGGQAPTYCILFRFEHDLCVYRLCESLTSPNLLLPSILLCEKQFDRNSTSCLAQVTLRSSTITLQLAMAPLHIAGSSLQLDRKDRLWCGDRSIKIISQEILFNKIIRLPHEMVSHHRLILSKRLRHFKFMISTWRHCL